MIARLSSSSVLYAMAPEVRGPSEDSSLNVNILKEIARKDLVDALNSVRINHG